MTEIVLLVRNPNSKPNKQNQQQLSNHLGSFHFCSTGQFGLPFLQVVDQHSLELFQCKLETAVRATPSYSYWYPVASLWLSMSLVSFYSIGPETAETAEISSFVTFQKSLLNSSKLNVRFLAKVNVNDQRTLLGRTLQKMSSLAECGTMWRRTSSTLRHQGQRHGEYQCWRSYWWQGRGKCLLGTWTPVKFINYGTSYVPHENYWAPYGRVAFPLDPQVLPPTCQFLQKTQFHHPTLLPAYKIKHLFIYNVGPIVLF